jgi:hypothetical protein
MAIDWDDLVLGPVMGIFGDGIIYMPRGGTPIPIEDAVFDEEAKELVIGDDGQATTQKMPILGIRLAALSPDLSTAPQQNDRVQIVKTGKVYLVREPIPDGHGHVLMKLMATA